LSCVLSRVWVSSTCPWTSSTRVLTVPVSCLTYFLVAQPVVPTSAAASETETIHGFMFIAFLPWLGTRPPREGDRASVAVQPPARVPAGGVPLYPRRKTTAWRSRLFFTSTVRGRNLTAPSPVEKPSTY